MGLRFLDGQEPTVDWLSANSVEVLEEGGSASAVLVWAENQSVATQESEETFIDVDPKEEERNGDKHEKEKNEEAKKQKGEETGKIFHSGPPPSPTEKEKNEETKDAPAVCHRAHRYTMPRRTETTRASPLPALSPAGEERGELEKGDKKEKGEKGKEENHEKKEDRKVEN